MSRAQLSFIPSIAKPCEQSWAEMQGGSGERHCELCNKQVHNFAAMTARQIEKLALERNGKFCARTEYREDGSLVTLDEPKRPVAAQWIIAASLAMSAAGLAAQTPSTQSSSAIAPKISDGSTSKSSRALLGEVIVVADSASSETQPVTPSMTALVDDSPMQAGKAAMTGTVMRSDGSGPREGAVITLRANGVVVANAVTNKCGSFEVSVPAGTYDFEATAGAERIHFGQMLVKEGEQSMGNISPSVSTVEVTVNAPDYSGATMGEVVSVRTRFGFWSIIRHPIQYARHLRHRN
jgi:hypothetical protein